MRVWRLAETRASLEFECYCWLRLVRHWSLSVTVGWDSCVTGVWVLLLAETPAPLELFQCSFRTTWVTPVLLLYHWSYSSAPPGTPARLASRVGKSFAADKKWCAISGGSIIIGHRQPPPLIAGRLNAGVFILAIPVYTGSINTMVPQRY